LNIKKICEEYYPLVYGYLLALTGGDRDLSEDLTQETFFRAIKNIGKFKGEAKVSTWLCQIGKYTFWQYIDKKNKYYQVSLDEANEIPALDLVEEIYAKKETNKILYENISKLDKDTKKVVLLRITGELSFKEIGELMGKTENWARVSFYRGKERLGKEMRGYE
jgi:RNA polymerase sigma-70 factor (ECF subfamily)